MTNHASIPNAGRRLRAATRHPGEAARTAGVALGGLGAGGVLLVTCAGLVTGLGAVGLPGSQGARPLLHLVGARPASRRPSLTLPHLDSERAARHSADPSPAKTPADRTRRGVPALGPTARRRGSSAARPAAPVIPAPKASPDDASTSGREPLAPLPPDTAATFPTRVPSPLPASSEPLPSLPPRPPAPPVPTVPSVSLPPVDIPDASGAIAAVPAP